MPSSVVSNFTYFLKSKTLRIVFVSGTVYDYKNVPEEVYLEMKASFSKGTYLNENIKGAYDFDKIE
ncbi:KTSC domain-containing protein [Dyadobacter sp. CY345]|uniref:KTSC domain-containing protein n=1 Tax=Dyadobacter sp. CY345 TaxID=2909335 RepID=UPI001F32B079|nr:KTSC domain-containing protein [Dyadobacter sp. CY345]